jgi:hypothetical protein
LHVVRAKSLQIPIVRVPNLPEVQPGDRKQTTFCTKKGLTITTTTHEHLGPQKKSLPAPLNPEPLPNLLKNNNSTRTIHEPQFSPPEILPKEYIPSVKSKQSSSSSSNSISSTSSTSVSSSSTCDYFPNNNTMATPRYTRFNDFLDLGIQNCLYYDVLRRKDEELAHLRELIVMERQQYSNERQQYFNEETVVVTLRNGNYSEIILPKKQVLVVHTSVIYEDLKLYQMSDIVTEAVFYHKLALSSKFTPVYFEVDLKRIRDHSDATFRTVYTTFIFQEE